MTLGVVRGTRNLTPAIRLIEIEPTDGFVPALAGQPHRLFRHDRRSARRPVLFGRRTVRGRRLPDRRQATRSVPRRLSLHVEPRGRFAPSAFGARQSFRPRARAAGLSPAGGGIGITPIFSHALALAHAGVRFRLIYACRSQSDLALTEELREQIGDRLEIVLSEERGRVDIAGEIAKLEAEGEFYVCGPIGMLEAAKQAWAASGRPKDRLRFETFVASGRWPAVPFTLKVPRLGKEIHVPATQSMLDALEAEGVEMIFDCVRGECGLCALPILGVIGVVDHRDVFFSEAEKAANIKLCTCVSRVYGSEITLDTADR